MRDGVIRLTSRIDVGAPIAGEGSLAVAVDIFIPGQPGTPALLLCCLPGGGLGRGYYDLQASDLAGAGSLRDSRLSTTATDRGTPEDLSFALSMTSRGFLVATIDPVGVGESDQPRNGFELTPDVLAAAHARAVEHLRLGLTNGTLSTRLPPIPGLQTVGVGHSLGAMLTVMQQARERQHTALLLFGFGPSGLPGALSVEEGAFAGDPVRARDNLVRLARARSRDPYPEIARSAQGRAIFAGENAQRHAVEALNKVRARLLVTAGLFSMIPGSSAPECAQVDVPIFLGVGDRDMAGPPHQIPASFSASPEVTLLVLPETGHCHFLFASRRLLYDRAADWIHSMHGRST